MDVNRKCQLDSADTAQAQTTASAPAPVPASMNHATGYGQ